MAEGGRADALVAGRNPTGSAEAIVGGSEGIASIMGLLYVAGGGASWYPDGLGETGRAGAQTGVRGLAFPTPR